MPAMMAAAVGISMMAATFIMVSIAPGSVIGMCPIAIRILTAACCRCCPGSGSRCYRHLDSGACSFGMMDALFKAVLIYRTERLHFLTLYRGGLCLVICTEGGQRRRTYHCNRYSQYHYNPFHFSILFHFSFLHVFSYCP